MCYILYLLFVHDFQCTTLQAVFAHEMVIYPLNPQSQTKNHDTIKPGAGLGKRIVSCINKFSIVYARTVHGILALHGGEEICCPYLL